MVNKTEHRTIRKLAVHRGCREEGSVGSLLVANIRDDGKLCSVLLCAAGLHTFVTLETGALIRGTAAEQQNQLWHLPSQKPKAVNEDVPVMRGRVLYM